MPLSSISSRAQNLQKDMPPLDIKQRISPAAGLPEHGALHPARVVGALTLSLVRQVREVSISRAMAVSRAPEACTNALPISSSRSSSKVRLERDHRVVFAAN